jgi:hypothetical protein
MSRKELEEELAELRASLSPKLLEKLKQMGNPKKQQPQTASLRSEDAKEAAPKRADDARPIEMA